MFASDEMPLEVKADIGTASATSPSPAATVAHVSVMEVAAAAVLLERLVQVASVATRKRRALVPELLVLLVQMVVRLEELAEQVEALSTV